MSGSLHPAVAADIDELMGWFPDAHSLDIWGGPTFRFPFDRSSFHEDCCWQKFPSYCLRNVGGEFIAFGQLGSRYERSHLARLVTNPEIRGRGCGRQLIEELMAVARVKQDYSEVGLFVYRDNQPAFRCYESLGFEIKPYPADASMPEKCYYMTKIL